MGMKYPQRAISGDTKVAAPLPKTAPRASNAPEFSRVIRKIPNLPLIAADCAAVKIVKAREEEIHRRAHYPVRELLPVH
jgi:hypothetical protein